MIARTPDWGGCSAFRGWGSGLRIQGQVFTVRVQGLEFRLGFRVQSIPHPQAFSLIRVIPPVRGNPRGG